MPKTPGGKKPSETELHRKFVTPQPGETITSKATGNSYVMGDFIGEGSFGIVYACKDTWDNDLAVKVLKPIDTYENVKEAADYEFAKLLQLRNPYITHIYDAFEYRDTFYIITERCYCPVRNLFSERDFEGPMWIMPIARCLLQAVYFMHLHRYVHQDIHPGNVFVMFPNNEINLAEKKAVQCKLGDFGVAKVFSQVDAKNTLNQWMVPPEVLMPSEFGPIDHRMDIYQSALLLLQVGLSKELHFSREEIIEGRPRELAMYLPSPYKHALEKALRRHADSRTIGALELWRELNGHSQAHKK
ncbi:MAG: protein kinase family protein [Endomicrobiales bacterium]|nr:protein kinase family protein [Endomicrobiales bacterium]